MKDEINKLLEPLLGATVKSTYSTGGGSINQTQVLELTNGERVFMKHNSNPPTDFFLAEVKGLRLLAQAENGPRIPKPIALQSGSRPTFLIMEYLENSSESKNFSDRLARALAELHRISQDHFGLDHDNFIGSTPQKNDLEKDGIVFFRDQRIEFQRQLARKAGLLPAAIDKKIDSLCDNLNKFLDITDEIITKLDSTAKGGVVLAICKKYDLPIVAIGMGEKEDDLQPFNAEYFSKALLGIDV